MSTIITRSSKEEKDQEDFAEEFGVTDIPLERDDFAEEVAETEITVAKINDGDLAEAISYDKKQDDYSASQNVESTDVESGVPPRSVAVDDNLQVPAHSAVSNAEIQTESRIHPGAIAVVGPSERAVDGAPENSVQVSTSQEQVSHPNDVVPATSGGTMLVTATLVREDGDESARQVILAEAASWHRRKWPIILGLFVLVVIIVVAVVVALVVVNSDNSGEAKQVGAGQTSAPVDQVTQIGADIVGSHNDEDQFGVSVSLSQSGSILAVGARSATYAQVYQRSSTNEWIPLGQEVQGEDGDRFGWSVSLSHDGEYLAVGAYARSGPLGSEHGIVEVYFLSDKVWIPLGASDSLFGASAGDRFGYSVDLVNDVNGILTIAIGAPTDDNGGEVDSEPGSVHVFQWTGITWVRLGQKIEGEGAGDHLGGAVSLTSGLRLAVAADFHDANGIMNNGHVRILDSKGEQWERVGNDIIGEFADERIGWESLAISDDGSTVLIGARSSRGDEGDQVGRVRAFEWDGLDWVQKGRTLEGSERGDQLGESVAISDNGLVIATGAVQADSLKGGGYVEWYEFVSDDWRAVEGTDLSGSLVADQYGEAVALDGSGKVLAIGANQAGNGFNGYVEVHCLKCFPQA